MKSKEKKGEEKWSPLTEGRGLKAAGLSNHLQMTEVAPHGGAWIEGTGEYAVNGNGRSPLTEGRGLKFGSS